VPGYDKVGEIGKTKEEFHVAGRVRHEPKFGTADGRAHFIDIETPHDDLAEGELRLMTIRSEGQFNTVVYEEHDRYRNQPARDVILMNRADISAMMLRDGDRVTVSSEVGRMQNVRVAE